MQGFNRRLGRLERPIYYLDTIGLGLFAALGAERAMAFGLGFWGSVFVGTVSGSARCASRGNPRHFLSKPRPLCLGSQRGCGSVLIYTFLPAYSALAVVLGTLVTIGLRLSSRWLGLRLPTP